jgi:hypothetical protein
MITQQENMVCPILFAMLLQVRPRLSLDATLPSLTILPCSYCLSRLKFLNQSWNRFNAGFVHEVKSCQLLSFGFGIIVLPCTDFQDEPDPPFEFLWIHPAAQRNVFHS